MQYSHPLNTQVRIPSRRSTTLNLDAFMNEIVVFCRAKARGIKTNACVFIACNVKGKFQQFSTWNWGTLALIFVFSSVEQSPLIWYFHLVRLPVMFDVCQVFSTFGWALWIRKAFWELSHRRNINDLWNFVRAYKSWELTGGLFFEITLIMESFFFVKLSYPKTNL